MTRVGVSRTIPKQSVRASNGSAKVLHNRKNALPKIESEDDAANVF